MKIIAAFKSILFSGRKMVVSVLAVWLHLNAFAQTNTLPELLEKARKDYPLIKAKQAEISSAGARVNAGRTDYLPQVFVQDQYTYSTSNNISGSFYPNEGIGLSTTGAVLPVNNYNGVFGSIASVAVDWKIFSFGKVRTGLKALRQEEAAVKADYENEVFQQQIKVADAYLLLLVTQKVAEAQENNLKRAASFRSVVQANVLSGMKPAFDTSLANAEYAKALLELKESRRNEAVQRLKLTVLTGGGNDFLIDSMNFYSSIPQFENQVTERMHPILSLYKSRAEASSTRANAYRISSLPSVSLVGSGLARGSGISKMTGNTATDFSSGTSYQIHNYLFGAVLRWNLTGFVKSQFDYASEKHQSQKNTFLYEEQTLLINAQVKEADIQIALAKERSLITPVQLEAAKNSFLQAQTRYENGLTDILSLDQAFYLLNRAEVDQYITVNNLWRALLMKSAATGNLPLFLNQIR